MMDCILPKDKFVEYNGIKTKWFIGDINHSKAKELGLNPRWDKDGHLIDSGPYWEAWGSCNGQMYQLFAWYNSATRELIDIHALERVEGQDHYFHQETYDMLTKNG